MPIFKLKKSTTSETMMLVRTDAMREEVIRPATPAEIQFEREVKEYRDSLEWMRIQCENKAAGTAAQRSATLHNLHREILKQLGEEL